VAQRKRLGHKLPLLKLGLRADFEDPPLIEPIEQLTKLSRPRVEVQIAREDGLGLLDDSVALRGRLVGRARPAATASATAAGSPGCIWARSAGARSSARLIIMVIGHLLPGAALLFGGWILLRA
jgi:hypothetical protein